MLERRLTEEKAPVEIINARFGELSDNEATHPVGRSGRSSASGSPAERVDLGVEDPGDFGETGPVEEVVEEEEGGCNLAQL